MASALCKRPAAPEVAGFRAFRRAKPDISRDDHRVLATHGISPSAVRLHAQGLLASFAAGHAGFVPDAFLDPFGSSAAAAVRELCLAGLWHRAGDGYRVVPSEALRMAHEVRSEFGRE